MKFSTNGILLVFILFGVNECREKAKNGRDKADQRYYELLDHATDFPVIKMNTKTFQDYTRAPARNYSIIVSYRLVGYRIPPIIQELYNYFETIAYSYSKGTYDKNVFFVVIHDNSEVQRLCSENGMNLIPLVIHYPPDGGYSRADLFDMRWSVPSLDSLLQFIKQRTKIDIKLQKDVSIVSVAMMLATVTAIGFFVYRFHEVLRKFNTRKVWAMFSVVFITLMFSGHMLNRINKSPFIGPQGIFSTDMRQQYGAESATMFLLYLGVIAAFVMVNDISNRRSGSKTQGFTFYKLFKVGYELFAVCMLCGSIFFLFKAAKFKLPWYPLIP